MISRRNLFAAAAGALAARSAEITYREYARCLPDYLAALAREAYGRRNEALAQLTSPEAVGARQQWARKTFWRLVGGMPARTPLNQKTTGAFERDGYRLEKIVYESRPGLHITGNLYLPSSGKPPYPGVLFQMGHSLNGKAAIPYQKCCQGLVRLGYIVLAFDPMGQGERTYYPKPGGVLTRLGSADDEHTVPGRQMLLVGDTSTRMQAWDAVRSLDVLASHPQVDPKRLASTGQSGGGTLTMMLAAVDDRLTAAVVSCGNTENHACDGFNGPGSTDDAEQNFIGGGGAGFDRWDLLYPFSPKPLLILASARDFFGTYSPKYLANGREEFARLRRAYEILGAGSRIAWDETPAPHALSHYLRTRIYAWFERWLHRRDVEDVAEPAVMPEPDEVLWSGATGNVVRDFGSTTPYRLARERALSLRPAGLDRSGLQDLLGIGEAFRAAPAVLGRVPAEGAEMVSIEVHTAPHVYAPAYLYIPQRTTAASSVLLIIEPRGRSGRWAEGGLYHELAAKGAIVCAADLRGIGDMYPEVGRGATHYTVPHSSEEAYAWSSLMLGRPLLGQRVIDLLAYVRAFRSMPETQGRRVVLAASGALGVPALFAFALEPGIATAYLAGSLASYRSLVEVEVYRHPTANFVRGILAETDLPLVAAMATPRKLILTGLVDGAGATMPFDAAVKLYQSAGNAEVRAEARWDAEALLAL